MLITASRGRMTGLYQGTCWHCRPAPEAVKRVVAALRRRYVGTGRWRHDLSWCASDRRWPAAPVRSRARKRSVGETPLPAKVASGDNADFALPATSRPLPTTALRRFSTTAKAAGALLALESARWAM